MREDMRVDIITHFPEICRAPLHESMMKRAQASGSLELRLHNLREWTSDKHHVVDDAPFGGGEGMVMKPEPIFAAVESLRAQDSLVILMTPQGERFSQTTAKSWAQRDHLIIVCGHYEGIDARVTEVLGAEELSVGDYVLTGGELAAMIIVDAVARLVPGVIDAASIAEESHAAELVEYPHYTRPFTFRGREVPEILLSGHHANIARWRRQQSLLRTARRRPDLLSQATLSPADCALIEADEGRDS